MGQDEVFYVNVDPAEGRNLGRETWVANTGCGDDFVGHCDMTAQDWEDVEPAPGGLCLHSANWPVCASETIAYHCTTTGEVIEALIMKGSIRVLCIGRMCHHE